MTPIESLRASLAAEPNLPWTAYDRAVEPFVGALLYVGDVRHQPSAHLRWNGTFVVHSDGKRHEFKNFPEAVRYFLGAFEAALANERSEACRSVILGHLTHLAAIFQG